MEIIRAINASFSLKELGLWDAPSHESSVETFDRTSSGDTSSSDDEGDCDSSRRPASYKINIQEEADGAISLVFDEQPAIKREKKRQERRRSSPRRRGRSRYRKSASGLPTNATLEPSTVDPTKLATKTKAAKRKGRKLGKALGTSLRSLKGELQRFQRTRTQEMLVIEPIDTFELQQELDQQLTTIKSSGF